LKFHKHKCYNSDGSEKKCEVRNNLQWCNIHTELHKKSIQRLKVERDFAKDTYTNFTVILSGHFTPFFTKGKYATKGVYVKKFHTLTGIANSIRYMFEETSGFRYAKRQ
jgi:hypothetical protein